MQSLKSSVLILGHPDPRRVEFGADFPQSPDAAIKLLEEKNYPVFVLSIRQAPNGKISEFLSTIKAKNPDQQIVLVSDMGSPELLKEVVNSGAAFKILTGFASPAFDLAVQEALAEYDLIHQNKHLLSLQKELNEKLTSAKADLEARVQKRQQALLESREKVLAATRKSEGFHRALVAIHRAKSIPEIEKLLCDAIGPALKVTGIRISYKTGSTRFLTEASTSIFTCALKADGLQIGMISYSREGGAAFAEQDTMFLEQISEAVALAIGRLARLEEAEILKRQWESTFDAITESVAIINSNYEIMRCNKSYADLASEPSAAMIGAKCYKALFGRETPCETCKLGERFDLPLIRTKQSDVKSLAVSSRNLNSEEGQNYVVIYRDVTEKQRYERRLLESAKLAELGLIGGSIAHELNNPIAGMLTFAQLLKMDLKGDEWYNDDIIEIEKGIMRCRDIVQNLLGFTRRSSLDNPVEVDLRAAIDQAKKIIELQSKSIGVSVQTKILTEDSEIKGHANLVTQALVNILQHALEAIRRRQSQNPNFNPLIEVTLSISEKGPTIEIVDNGIQASPEATGEGGRLTPGLGLTLAHQIIEQHGGSLEFLENSQLTSSSAIQTQAKISFPRPVF